MAGALRMELHPLVHLAAVLDERERQGPVGRQGAPMTPVER